MSGGWVWLDGHWVEEQWLRDTLKAPCVDCGFETLWGAEWFMVHDDVWEAAGMPYEGVLCVACLEVRLGRTLTAADFEDVPLNDPAVCSHSPRLRDRLAR